MDPKTTSQNAPQQNQENRERKDSNLNPPSVVTGAGKDTISGENSPFQPIAPPSISLPQGGGAIQGIGEKFQANPATGTGNMSVPIAMSPGRSGFGPQLGLSYDSGAGNGPFGLGWNVGVASIRRKTDRGLPLYNDAEESDTFMLSGAEDLVPKLNRTLGDWEREIIANHPYAQYQNESYTVYRYRPRTEGLFARIERWVRDSDGDTHWRAITGDNRTTAYGLTKQARVQHPNDPQKIFQWLIERSYDDKGNIILYQYKQETAENVDPALPQEKNRLKNESAFTRQYLKRVSYGNSLPYLIHEPGWDAEKEQQWWSENKWHFQLAFDYGDHDDENPTLEERQPWPVRLDPFSTYRAGFEQRTYRLCRRILMFHQFPELGPEPYLVRSTVFGYKKHPVATQLESVTHWSHEHHDRKASLPPVTFKYTVAEIDEDIYTISREEVDQLPLGGPTRWYDLEGEGLNGILSQHQNAWYYQRNLGGGHFGRKEVVAAMPSVATAGSSTQQLMDLGGNGKPNLVVMSPGLNGYYELNHECEWETFVPFEQVANVNLNDPNVRLLDITGDGFPDLVMTEENCFLWHASKAKAGYSPALRVSKALEEEQGPAIVFAESFQTIFLADMSGDGLADIVRIRNGEVCYWPNTGYGAFGAKVTMDQSPWFDEPDKFDPSRIRLGDIDGTGTADILYFGQQTLHYWHNLSGNGWSEQREIAHFPRLDNVAVADVIDLLGNGAACLVWASPLPNDFEQPMRYIPLMSQLKPYLLCEVDNNMGAVTRLQYAPSTKFYLEDRKNGKPWITKLPFPVQVLERIEVHDEISNNRFVSRYAYHHGYFDGEEREFRGFGMVEQWDTEDYDTFLESTQFDGVPDNWSKKTDIPPVYTKTWFHTGFYEEGRKISRQYEAEYYKEPTEPERWRLPDTEIPADVPTEEACEAARALRGRPLRQEVYALDNDPVKSAIPYTVTENKYFIRREQARSANPYASFYVCDCESLALHYERNPDDPRIAHEHTLEVGRYGNALKAASIIYPRRAAHRLSEEQGRMYITLAEAELIHQDDSPFLYRINLPKESRSYELRGLDVPEGPWKKETLAQLIPEKEVDFAAPPTGAIEKRLLGKSRIVYYDDKLKEKLPFGQANRLGIPCDTYTLFFTDTILNQEELEGKIRPEYLSDGGFKNNEELFPGEPGKEHYWWAPSGRSLFYEESHYPEKEAWQLPNEWFDDPAQRFFTPLGVQDIFGNCTYAKQDRYFLLPDRVFDPLGNEVRVDKHDYRLLAPCRMTDPNGNQSEVAFDTRGQVIATATMGKNGEGDRLANFFADVARPDEDRLPQIIDKAADFLGQATGWFYYDPFSWQRSRTNPDLPLQPNYAIGLTREMHVSDEAGTTSPLQRAVSYSDGFGRNILSKVQTEDGERPVYDEQGKLQFNPDGTVQTTGNDDPADSTVHRWIGTGRVLYNNKGLPYRQFEPFFDSHPYFTDHDALRTIGVSPWLYYDPLGRDVFTELPDGSITRVEFTPWEVRTYDPNDTIEEAESRWKEKHIDEEDDSNHEAANRRTALLTAVHADTPGIQHLDTLGRPWVSIMHNRFRYPKRSPAEEITEEQFIPTHSFMDIQGNVQSIWDGRYSEKLNSAQEAIDYNTREQAPNPAEDPQHGNRVMAYAYAMNGLQLFQNSMDAGRRWALPDAAGKPLSSWDDRGHRYRNEYDVLQRPTKMHVIPADAEEPILVERIYYGEDAPHAEVRNLRGQVYLHFDGAGLMVTEQLDFKGNIRSARRRLSRIDYSIDGTITDWQALVPDWSFLPDDPLAASAERTAMEAERLEEESFPVTTRYDALNRPVEITAPDGGTDRNRDSVYVYRYNQAGLLDGLAIHMHGSAQPTVFVRDIDYNARGQRTAIRYGNGVKTTYAYEPDTFRLRELISVRNGGTERLQELRYHYDPVGNITLLHDATQDTVFTGNQKIEPRQQYTYDSLYRLIAATGREANSTPTLPAQPDALLYDFRPQRGDLRAYEQRYFYDPVGNIDRMQHLAAGGSQTRHYAYAPDNNHLLHHHTGNAGPADFQRFTYDAHGSMIAMPHLHRLTRDYKDQLVHVRHNETGEGHYFYSYNTTRQRVRKVVFEGQRCKERIYLGTFELYREYSITGTEPLAELQTLHVMDDTQRICMVETPTGPLTLPGGELEDGSSPPSPSGRGLGGGARYQLANHLGSATLELDETAHLITYEEYHPYGTTAYRAQKAAIEVKARRYRYTGMERDEETGLNYHTARYYLPWLGRWGSVDPIGLRGGPHLYEYALDNPIVFFDQLGQQPSNVIFHDAMFIGDHPELSRAWIDSMKGVLERTFRRGSWQANLDAYYAEINRLILQNGGNLGTNNARGTAVHFARKIFGRVRRGFARRVHLPSGTQIHHFQELSQVPHEALSASNLQITSGGAKVNTTGHYLAHRAKNLHEQGVENAGLQARQEVRRNRQIAASNRSSRQGFTRIGALLTVLTTGLLASSVVTSETPEEAAKLLIGAGAGIAANVAAARVFGARGALRASVWLEILFAEDSPQLEEMRAQRQFKENWEKHVKKVASGIEKKLKELWEEISDLSDYSRRFSCNEGCDIMTQLTYDGYADRISGYLQNIQGLLQTISKEDLTTVRQELIQSGWNESYIKQLIK